MYQHFFKRFFDIVLSTCALIVLSPVLLITAVLVRVKLGSPVLFSQERVGKDERIFRLYKFRSMTEETDANGNLLPDNVRLTKLGKLLRSTSLDELPELFHILGGSMSIVGPRPLPVKYLSRYSAEQRHRHDIRPGLTGLAEVAGDLCQTWEEQFSHDLNYLAHITFWRDVSIVLRTIISVFRRKATDYGGIVREEFQGVLQQEVGVK